MEATALITQAVCEPAPELTHKPARGRLFQIGYAFVTQDSIDDLIRHHFGLREQTSGFVRGKGCPRCGQTGFRGRIGVFELLRFTPPIQTLIEEEGSTRQICDSAIRDGMRQMWQDGLEKARLGQTTLREVAKVAAVMVTAGLPQSARRSA